MTTLNFENLNLTEETLKAVAKMGFSETSPIQKEAIPVVLAGNDIIGQAQTGTGKTAAFAIPVIERIDPDNRNIQAVVLCPTRELVIQVTEEFKKLMHYKKGIDVTAIYGGQPIERQLRSLKKGTQIVVGTPGRTMDHLQRGSMKFHNIRFVVLDEADEMLDMGFREDIEVILKDAPKERQTIMFSATMPKEVIKLTSKYLRNPVHIDVTDKKLNAPKIEQVYYEAQEKNKLELLVRLIDMKNIQLGLVFCNTKSQVDLLVEQLKDRGYFADALHGDMNQNQRDKVMFGFRKGTVELLIATDVAGRGIDVNNIEAVINYDLPRDDEDYVHRIGRTARAGKTGIAISFVSTSNQVNHLKKIERLNGVRIKKATAPTVQEIETSKMSGLLSKVEKMMSANDLDLYVNQVKELIGEDNSGVEVAAALLKLSVEKLNLVYDQKINFENQIDHREQKVQGSKRYDDRRRRYSGKGYSGNRSEFGKRSDSGKRSEFGKRTDSGKRSEFGKRTDSGKRTEFGNKQSNFKSASNKNRKAGRLEK